MMSIQPFMVHKIATIRIGKTALILLLGNYWQYPKVELSTN